MLVCKVLISLLLIPPLPPPPPSPPPPVANSKKSWGMRRIFPPLEDEEKDAGKYAAAKAVQREGAGISLV